MAVRMKQPGVLLLLLLLLLLLCWVDVSREYQCTPGKYNKHERPYAGIKPTEVNLTVYVRNLNSIDESKFTYNLDYILYHRYNDPRLASNCTTPEFLKNIRKVDDIWFPNLGLINCHSSKEVQNSEKVTISANGDVFSHKRMTTQCYCIMDLHAFPMDTQHCPFRLESYIYSMTDLSLNWHKTAIQFEEGLQLVGYVQGESNPKKFTMAYSYGTWEVMEASFVFHREYLYYVYRVYVPTFLLMIFNFTSYWIPHSAMPARVTLIITTFLTITFILQHVTAQTAKATTTTSLQIFLIFSIVLVVIAILEFMIVLIFTKRREEQEAALEEVEEEKETNSLTDKYSNNNNNNNLDHPVEENNFYSINVPTARGSNQGTTEAEVQTLEPTWEIIYLIKSFQMTELDRIFRVLAPLTYIVFCFTYFIYFKNYHEH